MFPIIDKRETGLNLRSIMDRCGLNARDVQTYLGLGCVQSVYRWLDGINMPTIDNLYALSELFHMPIDEMVRGNRKMTLPKTTENIHSADMRLFAYYKKLNDLQVA